MEIDITDFVANEDPFNYSHSQFEGGPNAIARGAKLMVYTIEYSTYDPDEAKQVCAHLEAWQAARNVSGVLCMRSELEDDTTGGST
jgi:hypothetical protein